ncbi:hypothetical protein EG68_04360 [Paragonimus skrjabini miyazakii]|uniref:Apple domain-containing protein n=1 Tax=Paragonimus skrjabini miyazakii TaxID=59628 RepID=A0A8S9Z3A1_9TREM|nr:hypothetical protein EG68_04360 [Paragonimus skrjabini miyazakii]
MKNYMRHEASVSGRSKKILVLRHLLIFINILCIAMSRCPANFTEVDGSLCMLPFNRPVEYCEAHAECYAEGLKRGIRMFLLGKHTKKWMNHTAGVGRMLTGIHCLLHDLKNPRSRWMVSDPGCSDCKMEANFLTVHIFPTIGRLIVCDNQRCFQTEQDSTYFPFVCEISKYPQPNKWRETRYRTNWPMTIDNLFIPDNSNEGCFKRYKNLTTILCSHKCQINDVCRSFYYNSVTRDCYLALYVDSRLPQHLKTSSGSWVRFAKPDY